MRIAILGTRGIPNNYGGFEQFAEYLAVGLQNKGHYLTVYNPHSHEYKESTLQNVNIRRVYSPENIIGSSANYIYDFFCLRDALKRDFDIIYECGYQSSSISYLLLPIGKTILITNMDGLEWKRAKWSKFVKIVTRWAEKIAIKNSHYLISDNVGIRKYYLDEYGIDSFFIPYGATPHQTFNTDIILKYNLKPFNYYLNISRFEPENNIESIIKGVLNCNGDNPIILVGNSTTKYGKYLKNKYTNFTKVYFLGAIYDANIINNLRYYSKAYFHGHSVGGTNPALLEAMAAQAIVIAHNNDFNRTVLGEDGFYFSNEIDITNLLNNENFDYNQTRIIRQNNLKRIKTHYSWAKIIDDYESLFLKLISERN